MSDIDAFVLVAIMGCVWIVTSIQTHRLYRAFLSRYPDESIRSIPYAFASCRQPEKFFYFFRKQAQPLLKADPDLLRKRRGVIVLLWLSALVPVAAFVIMVCCMLLEKGRL